MSIKTGDKSKGRGGAAKSAVDLSARKKSRWLTGESFGDLINSEFVSDFGVAYTSTGRTIDLNPPNNNIISSKKLCVYRPELLAMLDFMAVDETDFVSTVFEDANTVLFNQRSAKRKMQENSSVNSLNSIAESEPELYTEALTQYESALASAAAEIALLKIAYQFKTYAKIGSSFSAFIANYDFDLSEFTVLTQIPMGHIYGSGQPAFENLMKKRMGWGGSNLSAKILSKAISEGKDASLFLQFLADTAFTCCFGTPHGVLSGLRFNLDSAFYGSERRDQTTYSRIILPGDTHSSSPHMLTNLYKDKSGLIRASRDLTASVQIGKIAAAAGDEDENLKNILEKYVESDFFTSTTKFSRSMFANLAGWDPFGSAVSSFDNIGNNDTSIYFVPDFVTYSSGIVSNIFTSDERTAILSSDSDSYQSGPTVGEYVPTKSYSGSNDLVEAAFQSDSGIDLSLYSTTVSSLQDSLEDFSGAFLQLFKLLDKRGSVVASDSALTENVHPTSPLNIYAKILTIFEQRFTHKMPACIGFEPTALGEYWDFADELASASRDVQIDQASSGFKTLANDFYKCWGILLMITRPDLCVKIIEKFIDDYLRGYLTYSETSTFETLTDSASGEETEVEIRANVLPGTETEVDLSASRGGLYNYLAGMYEEFMNPKTCLNSDGSDTASDFYISADGGSGHFFATWVPNSPTNVFAGSVFTERHQQNSLMLDVKQSMALVWGSDAGPPTSDLYLDASVGEDDKGKDKSADASSFSFMVEQINILAHQQLATAWGENDDGTVAPLQIIPIAGGMIDAVMSVLYDCLSPILNITSVGEGDPFWPAVESKSPPYHVQYLTDVAGYTTDVIQCSIGTLDANLNRWVPVLNAIKDTIVRSEDQTTYFANAELSSLFGTIVEAFAACNPVASNMFDIVSAGASTTYAHNARMGKISAGIFPLAGDDPLATAVPSWSSFTSTQVGKNISAGAGYKFGGVDVKTDDGAGRGSTGLLASNWANYMDWNAYHAGVDDGATGGEENIIAAMLSAGAEQYTTTATFSKTGCYSISLFASLKTPLPSSTSILGDTAVTTPSQWLDKCDELDDWTEAWRVASRVALDYITSENQSGYGYWDEPTTEALMKAMNNGSIAELMLGIDNVPQSCWWIMNASGRMGSSATTPISAIFSKTFDELMPLKVSAVGRKSGAIADPAADANWSADFQYGNSMLWATLVKVINRVSWCVEEDIAAGMCLDVFRKFGERIADYSETAVDGLTTEDDSDPSPLEILLGELTETTAGVDVLQNLSTRQLNLKAAGLERQIGDVDKGYVSKSEIITDNDILAIKTLMSESSLISAEGKNAKTFVIGLPSGILDVVCGGDDISNYEGPVGTSLNDSSDVTGKNCPLLGLRVTGKMPDYPTISLIPKIYRFDSELFCLPDVFDNIDVKNPPSNWAELVVKSKFTRLRFLTEEADPGSSEKIIKVDGTSKLTFGELVQLDSYNETLFDIYSNTLASYVLEKYYKLMIGLAMSEDDFNTSSTGLEIPINEYAVDLATALAGVYTDLESDLSQEKIDELFMPSSDIESLANNAMSDTSSNTTTHSISTYSDMVKSFQSEIADGEFSEIDASLFEGFTNSASSRLMSAGSMRDKIIGAKYFDRVYYLIVDPDEFLIAGSEAYEAELDRTHKGLGGEKEEQAAELIIANYSEYISQLETAGTIEPVHADLDGDGKDDAETDGSPAYYKLTVRPDEGNLSFASFYTTLVREPDVEGAYKTALRQDISTDLMVDSKLEGEVLSAARSGVTWA
jgi:hypothetical protein